MFLRDKMVDGSEDADTEFHKGQRRKTPTLWRAIMLDINHLTQKYVSGDGSYD